MISSTTRHKTNQYRQTTLERLCKILQKHGVFLKILRLEKLENRNLNIHYYALLVLILCINIYAAISKYPSGVIAKDAVKSAEYIIIGTVKDLFSKDEGVLEYEGEVLNGYWLTYKLYVEYSNKTEINEKGIIKVKVFESSLKSPGLASSKFDLYDYVRPNWRYLLYLNSNLELVQPQGSVLQINETVQLEKDHVIENVLIASIIDENYNPITLHTLESIPNLDIDFEYPKLKNILNELSGSKNDQISREAICTRIRMNESEILDELESRIAGRPDFNYVSMITPAISSWSDTTKKNKLRNLLNSSNNLIRGAAAAALYNFASIEDTKFFLELLDDPDDEVFIYSVWSLSKLYNLTGKYAPGRGPSAERKEEVRKLWIKKLDELRVD